MHNIPTAPTTSEAEPFELVFHFDPARPGFWYGVGQKMGAVCGQSEWIATTDDAEAVTCRKCLRSIERVAV